MTFSEKNPSTWTPWIKQSFLKSNDIMDVLTLFYYDYTVVSVTNIYLTTDMYINASDSTQHSYVFSTTIYKGTKTG